MERKLNQSDLSTLLAKHCGLSASKADTFTRTFFEVIIEGLESDGIVKINGLGTFKLIDVADRNSVNVNTREKIEIKGHRKITFVPADNLKDKVNSPFAMFEPVEIDDSYVDDNADTTDDTGTETEEATETTVEDFQTLAKTVVEDAVSTTRVVETIATYDVSIADETAQIATVETNDTTASDATEPDTTEISKQTETVVKEEKEEEKQSAAKSVETIQPIKQSKRNSYKYIIFSLLILLPIVVVFYWQHTADKSKQQQSESKTVENVTVVPVDTIIPTDTVNTDEKAEEVPFVLIEELSQTKLSVITLKDTTLYKTAGNMAVHRVGLDETLVKISLVYYNDKRLWPYIVKHNNLRDHNQLEIGMEIQIPRLVPLK